MELERTAILGGRVWLDQPMRAGLRATTDSVLCAAACAAAAGDVVADFGAGTGAVGLCVAARVPGVALCFVDIQAEYAALAAHNATLNNVAATAHVGDVATHRGRYNHVVMNPPYFDAGAHSHTPDARRAAALNNEDGMGVWVAAAARCLRPRGTVTIVHRADAIGDILAALSAARFGAVQVWPFHPFADQPAHRVVIRAVVGRRTKLTLHPGIPLHDDPKTPSRQSRALLIDAHSLGLGAG